MRYRIESARKPGWDYTLPGWYFVTICTQGRKPHFGRVANATVIFSPIGECADACWKEVPQHHQHVDVDEFVVMPNHMHAIVIIGGPDRLPELRKREKFKRVAELNDVRPKANSLGAWWAHSSPQLHDGAWRSTWNSSGNRGFMIESFGERIH